MFTPAVADRHRDHFAGLPLPKSPSFDEADVSDKPMDVRALPRLSPLMQAGLTEVHQQRLEALLAVDEAVAKIVRPWSRSGS